MHLRIARLQTKLNVTHCMQSIDADQPMLMIDLLDEAIYETNVNYFH